MLVLKNGVIYEVDKDYRDLNYLDWNTHLKKEECKIYNGEKITEKNIEFAKKHIDIFKSRTSNKNWRGKEEYLIKEIESLYKFRKLINLNLQEFSILFMNELNYINETIEELEKRCFCKY